MSDITAIMATLNAVASALYWVARRVERAAMRVQGVRNRLALTTWEADPMSDEEWEAWLDQFFGFDPHPNGSYQEPDNA